MTIDRQHGKDTISCDTCGEVMDRGSDTFHFSEWIDALKEEGWRIYKVRDVWQHECPDCAKAPSRRKA